MENNNNKEEFYIPENYREPSASDNYLKLKPGETRIRIMSSMIMGWEDWTSEETRKPVRFKYEAKPKAPINPASPIKLFWAFVIWNYAEKRLQILHVTQASIRRAIHKLATDNDWGNPRNYDLKISRTGEDKNTVYAVVPSPKTAMPKEATEAFKKANINLEALFTGEDPFNTNLAAFEAFSPAKKAG